MPTLRRLRDSASPRAPGPAAHAPVVRRGKQIRDLVILRLLALERLIRGLVVLLAAYAVFRFRDSRVSVQKAFSEDLPAVENLAKKFHWDIANSSIITDIQKILQIDRGDADAGRGRPVRLRRAAADRGHRPMASQALG